MFLYIFFYLIAGLSMQSMIGAEITSKTGDFDYTKLSFEQRREYAPNEIGKQLFDIIISKKTNLVAALDVESLEKVIELVKLIGPFICMLKIHVETFSDAFNQNLEHEIDLDIKIWSHFFNRPVYGKYLIDELIQLAKDHNFLIMEDRKFSDIGNTVEQQYTGGIFKRASWSHLVTAHSLAGPGMIEAMHEALKKAQITAPRGVVMLPQMSSKDNLLSPEYTLHTLMQILTLKNKGINLPTGIISRSKIYFNNEGLDYGILRITPGIGLYENTVKDQQYITPQKAFNEMGTDIAIVGRAIYNSNDPVTTTKELQQLCWNAYTNRLSQQ